MMLRRMIELLDIEHQCMLRKSCNGCDGKCENCELVQDDGELNEMYTDVIRHLQREYDRCKATGEQKEYIRANANEKSIKNMEKHFGNDFEDMTVAQANRIINTIKEELSKCKYMKECLIFEFNPRTMDDTAGGEIANMHRDMMADIDYYERCIEMG